MKVKQLRRIRRVSALLLSVVIFYGAAATAQSKTAEEALHALLESDAALGILRWELGDWEEDGALSFPAAFALSAAPVLTEAKEEILSRMDTGEESTLPDGESRAPEDEPPEASGTVGTKLRFEDNGVASRTIVPKGSKGYMVIGSAYISTSTSYKLKESDFDGGFDAKLTEEEGPQVLILHTHGSEAYTMPKGEKYVSTGNHRTSDTRYNVVRVGDEIAEVLAAEGISVVHDRTLYDAPYYDGAYDRALVSIQAYLEKYPSIHFVLDIHRDAITDSEGRQYKVISKEEKGPSAQMTLVMGSDAGSTEHPNWMENMKLAVALQQHLLEDHPTIMRPMLLRKSCYNQNCTTGSMLVEMGAAGNSLDEALYAAQIFAKAFAEVIRA